MKRTQIEDYKKIEHADDLDSLVKDKRKDKGASKQKVTRRNRHYGKTLLKQFSDKIENHE
jgi:hypothetical protein